MITVVTKGRYVEVRSSYLGDETLRFGPFGDTENDNAEQLVKLFQAGERFGRAQNRLDDIPSLFESIFGK